MHPGCPAPTFDLSAIRRWDEEATMGGRGSRGNVAIVGVAFAAVLGLCEWPGAQVAGAPDPSVGNESEAARADSSCHSRADCGPVLRGGLQITFTGWSCTTGFVAGDST